MRPITKRFREWLGRKLAWLAVRVTYPEPIYTWQLRVLTRADYEKQVAEMARAEAAMRELFAQARAEEWSLHPGGIETAYEATGHKPPSGMN